MNPRDLAVRFVLKGQQDLAAAEILSDNPNISDDIVGFHCQQAVEKFLKAVLADYEVSFRKTHDLEELTSLLEDQRLPVPDVVENFDELEPFAVTARYDFFDDPIDFDRQQAVQTVQAVLIWVKGVLEI